MFRYVLGGLMVIAMASVASAGHKPGHSPGGGGGSTATLGDLDCTEGMIAKIVGGAWICAEDVDTNTQLDAAGIEALVGTHTVDTDTALTDAEVRAIVGEHLEILGCDPGDVARLDPQDSGLWQCLSLRELQLVLSAISSPVFVTSIGYSSDLLSEAIALDPGFSGGSGLEAGDFICRDHAESAGYGASYIAWLSDSTTDAKDRLENIFTNLVTVNGALVALDLADLIDGDIASPINLDETEAVACTPNGLGCDPGALVWTGTLDDGTAHFDNWDDWTRSCADGSGQGLVGHTVDTNGGWTEFISDDCGLGRLYCFPVVVSVGSVPNADGTFGDPPT